MVRGVKKFGNYFKCTVALGKWRNVLMLLGVRSPIWEMDIKMWNGEGKKEPCGAGSELEASMWTHDFMYTYTHTRTCMYTYTHVHINMYTCICIVHVYVYIIYIWYYVCMYVYKYMYIFSSFVYWKGLEAETPQ